MKLEQTYDVLVDATELKSSRQAKLATSWEEEGEKNESADQQMSLFLEVKMAGNHSFTSSLLPSCCQSPEAGVNQISVTLFIWYEVPGE